MNKHMMEKEKLTSSISREFNTVWLRWIFLVIFTPVYAYVFHRAIGIYFVGILVLCIIYNLFNSLYSHREAF